MERALDAFASAVGLAPYSWLRAFGAALGTIAGSVFRIRRGHVESAMDRAAIDPRFAPSMYRSLGAGLFELLWLAGRRRRVSLDGLGRIDERSASVLASARARGRGVVIGASHTGNWDLAACLVAQQLPLLVVTKHLSVRALDRFWQKTRARFGVHLAGAERALTKGRAHLAAGGAVAMMIDQVPLRKRHALRSSFLGADVWLDRAPATLAARTGAPLVVAAAHRTSAGDHVLTALDMFEPPENAGAAWIEQVTRDAARSLERFVREHPESWLWLHRRWREPAG